MFMIYDYYPLVSFDMVSIFLLNQKIETNKTKSIPKRVCDFEFVVRFILANKRV